MVMLETGSRKAVTDAAIAALIAGLAGALLAAGIAIHDGGNNPLSAAVTAEFSSLMGLASALLGAVVLGWWCTALLMAVLGRMLCALGHTALGERLGQCSPGFMRRLVLLVFSLNLVATPVMAGTPNQEVAAVQAPIAVDTDAGSVPHGTGPPRGPVWQPTERHEPPPGAHSPGPRWTPGKTASDGDLITRSPRRSAEAESGEQGITVQPGDTLWSLCAGHLGPYATDVEIAQAWPTWYAANRQLIGPDPDLLLPGQVLRIPTTSEA